MSRVTLFGVASVIIGASFFLAGAVYVYWWIAAGEIFNRLLPPGTTGPLDPLIALGSVRVASNLNLSNIAFSVVYVALLILINIADGLLANLVHRVQQTARLPPIAVVQHYQDTGYTGAVMLSGTAQKWKKVLRRQL